MAVTRAKSQLNTLGCRAFRQEQSGLPALLAARSAALGADDGGTAAEAGLHGPVNEVREDLADPLQRHLTGRGITDLERAVPVGGHPVDLLFTDAGENTAVLIDPSPGPATIPRGTSGSPTRAATCSPDCPPGATGQARPGEPDGAGARVADPGGRDRAGTAVRLNPVQDGRPGGRARRPAQPPGRLRTTNVMCWRLPALSHSAGPPTPSPAESGPFAQALIVQQRRVEAFDLAVGLRPVGPGALVCDAGPGELVTPVADGRRLLHSSNGRLRLAR
ncbi:hypothetical protein ABZ465_00785 [Streptomyces griseoincarnatus]